MGACQPGGTLVEATAGNTGLGLALVASQKGYRLILVIPDKMAQEKIFHLRALGAEVRMTRSDVGKGHAEYYQDMAERLAAEIPGAFYVNQFGNPANPLAHEQGTGPEIWEQMDHDVDAVVVGVGSGGTLTGIGRFFERVAPKVGMILADPKGSILARQGGDRGNGGGRLVAGGGNRRGFRAPELRSVAGARGLHHHRCRELRHRARAAEQGGDPGRLLHRHPARRGAEILPRPDARPSGS